MKIITPEFVKLFENYPLASQPEDEDALVIARLHDKDFQNILLVLEYDPESKKAFCFHLERSHVDKENLLTWYNGDFVHNTNIAGLEKTGGFQRDLKLTAGASLWDHFVEADELLPVSHDDILVLSALEAVDRAVKEVINESGKMKHVFKVQLYLERYEEKHSFIFRK